VTTDAAAALHAMRRAAAEAGIGSAEVDAEAAAFAAGICADDDDADGWANTFGQPAAAFSAATARGRAWRSTATPLLCRLANDPAHAAAATAYARGLVDLASATATIGAPNLDRINAAGFAASAQLRAVAPPNTSSALTTVAPFVQSLHRAEQRATAQVATAAQAPPAAPAPAPTLAELLAQLDGLIGLTRVKDEVRHQTELLRIDRLRTSEGLKTADVSDHLVFTGNPGTGKTTVARLVAGIYRALGVLKKGQLVETDRSGLVAGYVGQTALKTADVVKSAIGGVLFVDEAYALASDQFGAEAIDTLVKAMEDHRDELVLIVAGYTDEMATFIDANPGLASRFRTTIEFADYTNDELVAIFEQLCNQTDFSPTDACVANLRTLLAGVHRDRYFGNARFIRNEFEAAIVRQAWRLRDVATPTVDQLKTLEPDDLATST
jgi:hypothetical protein